MITIDQFSIAQGVGLVRLTIPETRRMSRLAESTA